MSRIAIFTNSIYTMGGEQRVVSIMANEFVKKHDVTIFTMDPPSRKENMFGLSEKVNVKRYLPYQGDVISFIFRAMTHLTPWIVYDMFPVMLERAYCHRKYAKMMYELIGEDYDVVIATAWQLSIILGQVCKRYPHAFKAIGWQHNSFEAYFREKYIYLYNYEKFFADNVRFLDHNIVLNQDYAEKFREKMNLEAEVIYNPKSFFSEKKSNLTEKKFVACARLDYSKGFDLLIEAFGDFAKKDDQWQLYIAGDGKIRKKLEKAVRELELDNRIIFLGRVSNVRKLLQESSIFVLSSRFEGFPMSITEACEVGLPIIAFDIPAMIPFKESGAAEVVECFNTKELASTMFMLAYNYEKRCALSKKALEMSEKLSPEKIMECWEKCI